MNVQVCRAAALATLISALAIIAVRAQGLSDQLAALESAVLEEEAHRNSPTAQREWIGRGNPIQAELADLRRAVEVGSQRTAEEALRELTIRHPSAAVKDSATKLHAAIVENQKRQTEEVEAALTSTRQAIENAKAPGDLDGTLVALDKMLQQSLAGASGYLQGRSRELLGAREVTTNWQNYLDAAASGDIQRAVLSLQDVCRETSVDLLPRSIVLGRIASLSPKAPPFPENIESLAPKIEATVVAAKTLDDIPQALALLAALPPPIQGSYDDLRKMVENELVTIRDSYEAWKSGLPVSVTLRSENSFFSMPRSEALRISQPLRTQLLRLVAPRFLRIESAMGPEETVEAYLARITNMARERLDARLLSRLIELRTKLDGTSNYVTMPPALQVLLAGQNQEEAGQIVPAVVSYQRALNVGGDLVPAKVIGARLDMIKEAHPAEYQAGLQVSLANPALLYAPFLDGSHGYFMISVPGAPTSPPR